jgi:hypothetical protein
LIVDAVGRQGGVLVNTHWCENKQKPDEPVHNLSLEKV